MINYLNEVPYIKTYNTLIWGEVVCFLIETWLAGAKMLNDWDL